jgi:aspartate ammonia-lyase
MLDHAVQTFILNCIVGITANEERCMELLESSVGVVTALCPHIGYTQCAELAKEALNKQVSVRSLVLEKKILTQKELDTILNAYGMTKPGISGKELLES